MEETVTQLVIVMAVLLVIFAVAVFWKPHRLLKKREEAREANRIAVEDGWEGIAPMQQMSRYHRIREEAERTRRGVRLLKMVRDRQDPPRGFAVIIQRMVSAVTAPKARERKS